MTAEEIAKGNKIIADFDGIKIGKDLYSWRLGSMAPIQESDLNYHASWGWIMPAVIKINLLGKYHFIIYGAVVEVTDESAHTITKCSITDSEPLLIEAVWQCLVEFLKWYNQQK